MTAHPIPVLRLHGFREHADGHVSVYAWCGHRWNQYGWTPGDSLRVPHCKPCFDAGVAHLYVDAGEVTRPVLTRLRIAYESPKNHGPSGPTWQEQQERLLAELVHRSWLREQAS